MIVGIVMGLGIVAYYEGLKRLKAAQVFVLELTTPFFASAIAYLTLRETITAMQGAGIALMPFEVYFLSRREAEQK